MTLVNAVVQRHNGLGRGLPRCQVMSSQFSGNRDDLVAEVAQGPEHDALPETELGAPVEIFNGVQGAQARHCGRGSRNNLAAMLPSVFENSSWVWTSAALWLRRYRTSRGIAVRSRSFFTGTRSTGTPILAIAAA